MAELLNYLLKNHENTCPYALFCVKWYKRVKLCG